MGKLLLIITLMALAIAGCGRSDGWLDRADRLACEDPQAALELLDSIDAASLSRADRARFGLLRGKARDKNHEPGRRDSLLDFAAEYYAGRGDSLEVQALYYRGYALSQEGNIDEALVVLNEAHDKAVKNKDYFFAGMASRELANDYRVQLISSLQLDYSNKAMEYFTLAGANRHAKWMNLLKINALLYSDSTQKAYSLCDSLLSFSDNTDRAFILKLKRLKAEMLSNLDSSQSVIDLYEELRSEGEGLNAAEYCQIAEAYLENRDFEKAEEAHRLGGEILGSRTDTIYYYLVSAKLNYERGAPVKAFQAAQKWGYALMDESDRRISHPQNLMLTDYLRLKVEKERTDKELLIYKLVAVAGVSLVVLIVLGWMIIVLKKHVSQRNTEIRTANDRINRITTDKEKLETDKLRLEADKERIEQISAEMSLQLAELTRQLEDKSNVLQRKCIEIAEMQLAFNKNIEASSKENSSLQGMLLEHIESIKRQAREVDNSRQLIEALGESLTTMSAQYSSAMNKVIKTLFDYATDPVNEKLRSAEEISRGLMAYKERIQKAISIFGNPEKIGKLLASFDSMNGGKMRIFEKEHPEIEPRMLMLVKCRYLNFSHQMTMLILNYKDMQAYYRDRNRLKKEISIADKDGIKKLGELNF